ncbi:hypothetical protein LDG_7338 [Legionella drancourtii LLAP12]|uniref:Uncharacterized protein n=1 Tax=Legionella drancourtii LLAP12 TaxID=658187 RepID=G9EPZ6_9GAMM|nr:hypothetical protein LDG_7338 [Legionella drancourtii LLAP12]
MFTVKESILYMDMHFLAYKIICGRSSTLYLIALQKLMVRLKEEQ